MSTEQTSKPTDQKKKEDWTPDKKLLTHLKAIVNFAESEARAKGKTDLVKAVTKAVDRGARKIKDGKSNITFGDVVKKLSNKIISNPKPTTTDVDDCIAVLVEYRNSASEPKKKEVKPKDS